MTARAPVSQNDRSVEHPARGRGRVVRVSQIMGLPISVHVVTAAANPGPDTVTRIDDAISHAWAELREVDRLFSPFRADSQVSAIGRGELRLADADVWVVDVAERCEECRAATNGAFSAWWRGVFDPTGYVKGWAIDRVSARILEPLLATPSVIAIGVNAGGDMQLATRPGADWRWRVGIVDPFDSNVVAATLAIANGAIATSGTAARGLHIRDPRTGQSVETVVSATITAPRLTAADMWATAAAVLDFDELCQLTRSTPLAGMTVSRDHTVCRWAGGVELTEAAPGSGSPSATTRSAD